MRTISRDIVGAFVFSSDGKLLLGLHGPKSTYAGFWVVPGGGVDEGETKEQALRRECLEEVGLDLAPYDAKFVDMVDGDVREKLLAETGERVIADMHFHNYEVQINKPAIQIGIKPGEEFVELKWIALSDISNLKMPAKTLDGLKRMGYV